MSISEGDMSYQRYLFEYRFDGSEWGIEIAAKSPTEARERLNALNWAQYKGHVFATIPIASGPFSRAAAMLRNILRRS